MKVKTAEGLGYYNEVAHIVGSCTTIPQEIPYFLIAKREKGKELSDIMTYPVTGEEFWNLVRANKMSDMMCTLEGQINMYYTEDQLKMFKKRKIPVYTKVEDYFRNDMVFNMADIVGINPALNPTHLAICPVQTHFTKIMGNETAHITYIIYSGTEINDSFLNKFKAANLRHPGISNIRFTRRYANIVGVTVSLPYSVNSDVYLISRCIALDGLHYGVCYSYMMNSDAYKEMQRNDLNMTMKSHAVVNWYFGTGG